MNRPERGWQRTVTLTGVACFLAHGVVFCEYAGPDLRDVPVTRLIPNVERQVGKEPQSSHWHYILGRLHSMAYAKPDAVTDATTNEWDSRTRTRVDIEPLPYHPYWEWRSPIPAAHGEDRRPGEAGAKQWHLRKAIEHYGQAAKLDPKAYKAWLGLAWCVEQSGDRARAVDLYRRAFMASSQTVASGIEGLANRWEVEDAVLLEAGTALLRLRREGVSGVGVDEARRIEEAHRWMAARVPADRRRMPITPVVIGLDDGGEPLNLLAGSRSTDSTADFDLTGFGPESWGWLPKGWGLLVWDPRKTGEITSGRQLFGSVTWWLFWPDGYEPLSLLDDDGDGWLRGKELVGLSVWMDQNSDGRSQPGEVKSVEEMGIVAVRCQPTGRLGEMLLATDGARFVDGRTAVTADWLARRAVPAIAHR